MEQILELQPDRIALFSYAHVPWLKKQQGAFATHLPEGMEKFEIFRSGLMKFIEAGYLYIGMDHFAKPGDELAVSQQQRTLHRNFQGTRPRPGPIFTAWASPPSARFRTPTRKTIATCQRGRRPLPNAASLPCAATAFRTKTGCAARSSTGLLCHTVVVKDEISREFGVDFDEYFAGELAQLEAPREDGLVLVDVKEIRATWLGRIFIRNLAMIFDPYLEKQHLNAKPLFSKTL